MKYLDVEYFPMAVFTLVLNTFNVFANIMFNLNGETCQKG